MEDDLNGENVFLETCKSIEAFMIPFGKDGSIPPIIEIEKTLTSFLVALKFLANYKMASVKYIGYDVVRNNIAQFMHTYTLL